jgi:hypothetical protein
MRALLVVVPCLVACTTGGIAADDNQLLGCHAAVAGALTAQVGAMQLPHAGAFLDSAGSSVTLDCSSDDDPHTRLEVALPSEAGAFDAQATLLTHTIGQTDDVWYAGKCSGTVDDGVVRAGDWLRGSFFCDRLGGIGETDPAQFVTVDNGVFNLQLQQPVQR